MTRRSLAFRLLGLSAAAATLPALVIALILQSISSRALEESIQKNQIAIAQRVADGVNAEIRYTQNLLNYSAQTPPVSGGGIIDTQRSLQILIRYLPSLQEVMEVMDTGEERVKVTRQGVSGRLIKRNLNLSSRSIGAPFFSGNRLPTVLITEPLANGQGALVAKLSFTTLGTLMQQTRVGPRGMAFIVNSRGSLLAHPIGALVRAHTSVANIPVVQQWLSNPSERTDLHEYVDDRGVTVMAMAYPIPLLKSAVVVQQPKADVYAPLRQMRSRLILWTGLAVGVFLIITLFIAWRIQQPLRQLQSATEQIGQGQMDVKLDIHTGDELEDLGKAFTRMANSLRQLEAMRRDLISMIVHDLKSPLSSVLTSIDYLFTGQLGPLNAEQRKFLLLGHRSGTEMLMLVQNLLDVAKLEEGKLPMNKEPFAPLKWAEEVVGSFKAVAEAGRKSLQLVVSPDVPTVEGDAILLGRVLRNLIANALRHTPMNTGEVVVSIEVRNHQWAVDVRDNGQGIPREDQERIFEKFVQVERRRSHVRTGTGLGLTFCKLVVEAHQGRIFVQSVPEDGSTFTFMIPLPVSVSPKELVATTA